MERTYQMNGWDWVLSHKGLNEFYNDFNNYKVSIEVPEGFYIWATGTQTNAEEVFTPEFLKKYKQALLSNETTHLLSEKDNPAENLIGNIWKFKADFVPDFAFGTAPNFVWDVVNVSLDEKDVYVEAAYPYNEEIYHTTIDIARQTIEFTSETDPGVVFPYSHASVFNGMWYGGMEYPMITNVAATNDTTFFNLMIFHEIVHNYHPFSMGFNEKRYQYMDEGLTEFFTSQFLMQKHSWDNHYFATPEGLIELPVIFRYMAQDEDAPLFDSYGKVNVFNVVYLCYIKAELAYYLFQEMVGYERFLLAYKEFIKRWQGKHPTPWDMFYTFNDALGENYNWFWNAWFFDYGYPDLGINLEGDQLIIERLGVGSLPVPVKLNIEYTDGTTEEIYKPMDIWKNGEKEITLQLEKSSGIKSVWLDTHTVPDIDERNNRIDLN